MLLDFHHTVLGPFKHQVVMGSASGRNIATLSRITLLLMELKAFEMSNLSKILFSMFAAQDWAVRIAACSPWLWRPTPSCGNKGRVSTVACKCCSSNFAAMFRIVCANTTGRIPLSFLFTGTSDPAHSSDRILFPSSPFAIVEKVLLVLPVLLPPTLSAGA